MGRATGDLVAIRSQPQVISIHALRGEGDLPHTVMNAVFDISIHALRGEGDTCLFAASNLMLISIHALRGEGDLFGIGAVVFGQQFLSTPSVGRATYCYRLFFDKK